METTIKSFREMGDNTIKSYTESNKNIITIGNWVLSYCCEEFLGFKQKVLAISHVSKEIFFINKPFADIPELSNFFDRDTLPLFDRVFENRGYTVMYLIR